MEMDIAGGKIGEIGTFKVEFKDAKMTAQVAVKAGPLSGNLVLEGDAEQGIDWLVAQTENKIDDALGAMIKAALLSK